MLFLDGRPHCPDHPDRKVWFDGTYGKEGHKRQRYKCVDENGWTHVFTELLPRQKPPSGQCDECEHDFLKHEGPQSARSYSFTAREIATALVAVGRGSSYRRAAYGIRQRAKRFPETPAGWTNYTSSPQVVEDWVEVFAPILEEHYRQPAWPRTLLVDHVPFHIRQREYGKPKKSGRLAFVVYGALGQRSRGPYVYALRAFPSPTMVNCADFLRTLPGQPYAVLSDEAPGITKGVPLAWPGEPGVDAPFQFTCEYHLKNQARTILGKYGMHGSRRNIMKALELAFKRPENWLVFVTVARRLGLPELDKWLDRVEPIMAAQMHLKRYPTTVGALETKLREVRGRLDDRRFNFTNRERLDRLLMLMALDLNGLGIERRYAELIRQYLVKHDGKAPARRLIADKSMASLRFKPTARSRAERRKFRRKEKRRKQTAKKKSGP